MSKKSSITRQVAMAQKSVIGELPSSIEGFIEWANIAHRGGPLPHSQESWAEGHVERLGDLDSARQQSRDLNRMLLELTTPEGRSDFERRQDAVLARIKDAPIYDPDDRFWTLQRYQICERLLTTFRRIARTANALQDGAVILIRNLNLLTEDFAQIGHGGKIEITDQSVAFGDIHKRFLDSLDGVDATLVRECSGCGQLFLACRRKQKACSKRCRIKRWKTDHPGEWEDIQVRYERKRAELSLRQAREGDRRQRQAEESRRAPLSAKRMPTPGGRQLV